MRQSIDSITLALGVLRDRISFDLLPLITLSGKVKPNQAYEIRDGADMVLARSIR